MALSFNFSQGQPVEARIDSPASAAAAGSVVELGNLLSIAHAPISVGVAAVVSVGPARYRCHCATGDVSTSFAAGAPLYVLAGEFAATGKHFGFAPAAIAENATEFDVIFAPNGTVAA